MSRVGGRGLAGGCALIIALSGCGAPSRVTAPGSTYTLMQMNLCLSGLAGCYDLAVLDEAVDRIREARPDAVTFNEACQGDVLRIARRTGYHARFSRVIYRGERLRCVRPGDRGLFGIAVLTRAAVERAESQDFEAQAGLERRRWLCVTTEIDVCTAHLNTRSPVEIAGNDAQCAELAALLAGRTAIFGGDVNRRDSCAPDGFWTRTDAAADQAPGLQHVYGSGELRSPAAEVLPAAHTDHDVLVVSSDSVALEDELGGPCRVRGGCIVPVRRNAGDLFGGEAGACDERKQLGERGSRVRDTDAERSVDGVHVHDRQPGSGREVVPDGGADAAPGERADGASQPRRARRCLHDDVVCRGAPAARPRPRGEHVCTECFRDPPTQRVVVDVFHNAGTVCNREARGVQADAFRTASDDQHRTTGPVAQRKHDAAPRIGEVVARRGDPQGRNAGGNRHEHVVGERDA